MKVEKKDLEKSQIELSVELSLDEFKPYIDKGAVKVSQEVKIDGFRSGKVPYEILKQKIGEMSILEEAARIAINRTLEQVLKDNLDAQAVGQPQVNIIKLAPDNPMQYKAVVAVLPEITLGEYKNLKVKKEKVEVKKEEIQKMLEQLREMQAKEVLVEREVKEGDKVVVDMNMFLDKVPLEGGQSKGTAIMMGKDYIVPGFDKNLLGTKKGDTREFKLPYPADYHQKNLAGKMVEFKVIINDVYERKLPELNDEFAAKLGAKNVSELEKNAEKGLKAENEQKEDQKTEIKIIEKIVKKTKFGDIPELLINNEIETMIHELEHNIANQGGKFDDYLKSINKTRDQLTLDLLPDALKRVKSALIIREIITKEKIRANEEDVDKKIKELLEQYKGYKKVEDRIKEPGYREHMRNLILNQKVVRKLKDWNLEK